MDLTDSLTSLVVGALCAACNVDPASVDSNTSLIEMGMDSLSLTAVVTQVEAAYGCELSAEQILELFQAESIQDLLERLSSGVATAPVNV